MMTLHIQYSDEELKTLERSAASVGLSRTAYVRQASLVGKVKGYSMKPVQAHSEAVGEVAAAVRDMIAQPHPDRWAYEADIERIEDLLKQLIDSEATLITDMTRRLKR